MSSNIISISKLNKVKVKPIKLPKVDEKKIKHCDLFDELYFNVFICSRKKTGKTTQIWNILKCATNKLTTVFFFVPSIKKDRSYREIIKKLNDKGVDTHEYTAIKDDEGNHLQALLEYFKSNEDPESDEEKKPKKQRFVKFPDDTESEEEKPYKPKKLAPEFICVFDDLGSLLKDKNVANLLKTHRHYKCSCIISSQYPNDLDPQSRKQIDYWLLGCHHSDNKLLEIHQIIDTSLPYEIFKKLYEDATSKNYNFLYIDTIKDNYRKNYNLKYNLKNF